MTEPRIPCHFDSLSLLQLQNIETRAILENNNRVRFLELRAGKGSVAAQREFLEFLRENPDWLR